MEKIQLPARETGDGISQALVCFSHLRWNFVYQRPQHLMSRFANCYRVFFVEEPVFEDCTDHYRIMLSKENVHVVTPVLHFADSAMPITKRIKLLVDKLFAEQAISEFVSWYYTPMALKFTSHLQPNVTVYDCMDELSAFKFAPAEMRLLEAEMFKRSDVVFTGGQSLYHAKRKAHNNIHACPSSIDKRHFRHARHNDIEPADQQSIPALKLGFYGVIDERFDTALIEAVALQRPEWQFVMIGPVVKIKEEDLPQLPNIHYMGGRSYDELPAYLSGWDIALIPFAKNESTRFISPTKTPEYLAGGKPVISSSIMDVVEPYATQNLVHIADDAATFIEKAEKIFSMSPAATHNWLKRADAFLDNISWDKTAGFMLHHMDVCMVKKQAAAKSLKSVA